VSDSPTMALQRRDDELTMPGDGEGAPAERPSIEAVRDGLPRDGDGRVAGEWHVSIAPIECAADRCVAPESITGNMVDRAVSLGCFVAPGPRASMPGVVSGE
jgi:hypothetical protein